MTSDVKGTGLSGVMAALPFYTKAKTQTKIPLVKLAVQQFRSVDQGPPA